MDADRHNPACYAARDKRRLSVAELFGSCKEIELEFRGEIYRLRITRNDKLILTK